MNKSTRKLWIPITMLIVGIIMASFALLPVKDLLTNTFWVNGSSDSGTVTNGPLTTATYDVSSDINELNLNLALADTVTITFSDTPTIEITGKEKGIDSIKLHSSDRKMKFETNCYFPSTCNNDYSLNTVTVQLPTSFNGKIKVNGLSSKVSVIGNGQVIEDIDINSLDTNVTIENITSDFSINGADITFNATNIGGELDIDGMSMKATLSDLPNPMEIDLNGMDATLTFLNFNANHGYIIKMNGMDSRFTDNRTGETQTATLGDIKVDKSNPNGSFNIKMDGMSQELIINGEAQ